MTHADTTEMETDQQMIRGPDRMVFRSEIRSLFGGIAPETLRRWIRDGKVPPPDVNLSQKTVAWRTSTLRKVGIAVPAEPPKLEPAEP